MTATSVMDAVTGACWKFVHATGARLKPMSATIDPATTGGMSLSIQPMPANCTMKPTAASRMPTATMPASAEPMPGRGGRRGDRGDERERRAEVAGQLVARDHEEQQRADAREEQRRRDREAGQHRHEEGRAEHRDDVLRADGDGRGQLSRSSGLTTSPGATVRPFPCRVQMGMRAPLRSGWMLGSP